MEFFPGWLFLQNVMFGFFRFIIALALFLIVIDWGYLKSINSWDELRKGNVAYAIFMTGCLWFVLSAMGPM